jgi:molecular chaperone GrpE
MTKKRVHPAESDEPVGAATNEAQAKAAPIPEELSLPMLKERIAVVEGEKAEIYDRMLRIAADFDNWKKRARKDQTDGEMRAKESVLMRFS